MMKANNYNELEVIKLAKKYGLSIQFVNSDTLTIKSPINSWYCNINKDANKLELLHFNKKNNKSGKMHKHEQRKFYDFEFMFRSIKDHDKYKGYGEKYNYLDKIDYLLKNASQINRKVLVHN